jgi:dienelactone hydrolase
MPKNIFLLSVLFLFLISTQAHAALQSRTVAYKDGDAALEGYLVYDDQLTGKRPAVIVFHEWWGLNDYIRSRADQVAALGYTVFAADVYGQGVRATTPDEAGKLAGKYKGGRPLLRSRAQAALAVVQALPNVDPEKIAATGYCFGGTAALELARSGADVKAIVSFHGGLSSPTPQDAKNIKAELLILHGADDTFVPPAEVEAFEKEMTTAGVKYTLVKYPGAVHGFTNPSYKGEMPGALYNADADKKSWEAMKEFLARKF